MTGAPDTAAPDTGDRPLAREDWERVTLAAIADVGLGGVHIDDLAARLKVTKGSFYWHFASRDAVLHASLASWRITSLAALEELASIRPPRRRLRALATTCLREHEGSRVEIALACVVDDERVTPFVEAVYRRRLHLFVTVMEELGAGDPQEAALLANAAFVGYLYAARVDPQCRPRLAETLVEGWLRLVTPRRSAP